MHALFYPDYGRLSYESRPDPTPAPDEVIVQVAACGLCGSELETFFGRSPRRTPPRIMGHEFCGTVAEIGADVTGWHVGDRVVSHSLVPCGTCRRCRRGDTHLCADRQIFGMHRDGAFAERVAVPARVLLPWPDGVPAEAACLAEPLANGVHMVHLTEAFAPETVAVVGAGPIGLAALLAFRTMTGAQVLVSDLSPERLAVAERLGAARTLDPRAADFVDAVRDWTDGEGADVVIDAVGSRHTKGPAIAATRPGGACVWIGLHEDRIELDTYAVTLPERHVLGTYAATQAELGEALALMPALDLTSWTTRFPLSDGATAFQQMHAAEGLKAVLLP